MPKATQDHTRFHNLSPAQLADALGRADAVLKAAEAEVAVIKAEIKARGVAEGAGDAFSFTVTESVSGRPDAAALRAYLGDAYGRFEKAVVATTIRVRAVNRLALAA